MPADDRNLLTVLKSELKFVQKGGYRKTARAPWRPHFIFQDSPTCLNFDPTGEPRDCAECILAQLIPAAASAQKVPCRFIKLNEAGDTIDSLYRYGNQDELEAALTKWLEDAIRKLEQESSPASQVCQSAACQRKCNACA
jgi:hypothetical protein